jgi:hypothetical protein
MEKAKGLARREHRAAEKLSQIDSDRNVMATLRLLAVGRALVTSSIPVCRSQRLESYLVAREEPSSSDRDVLNEGSDNDHYCEGFRTPAA